MPDNKLEPLKEINKDSIKWTLLQVKWKSGYWCLGTLLLQDPITDKIIAYIGVADGYSIDADIIKISEHGMKLSRIEAIGFFPNYAVLIRDKYRLQNDGYD